MNHPLKTFTGNQGSRNRFKSEKQKSSMVGRTVDLMNIHVPKEDTNIRRCLRVYTILPRFCEKPDERNEKAKQILKDVWAIREQMKLQFGRRWGYVWMEKIPYNIRYAAIKDWMIGRASIPLIAFDSLKKLGFKKEVNAILEKVEYVSSTTQEVVRLPKTVNPDLFYLTGLILGDGTLKTPTKEVSGFSVVSGKRGFLENKTKPIIEKNFEVRCNPIRYYCHGGPTWELEKRNKILFRFFTRIMKLPYGKKSEKAHIPEIVKKANDKKKVAFLCGLIDSDIGKHGRGMGSTFRSKKIVEDLIEFLADFEIVAKSYGTYYKDDKYEQNDFSIPKSQVKPLKELLLRNYLPKSEDRMNTVNRRAGVG